VRKLLVLAGLCLALLATPAAAAVDLGLPSNVVAHFDGNGLFDQSIPGGFDALGPLPSEIGTELFGVGSISGVVIVPDYGVSVWTPGDVGPNFEMTFTFWDAVVTSSTRDWEGTPGISDASLDAVYADGARVLLVADSSEDLSTAGGPGLFDLVDGEYPTAYTLEDAGYDADGAPDAGSTFTYADDPGEEVFLDLLLNDNTSHIEWSPTTGFKTGGTFNSAEVEILGGSGASQFANFTGPEGQAWAFLFRFGDYNGWAYPADIDIELATVPEPVTLIFLGTGLASLVGYKIRRRMA